MREAVIVSAVRTPIGAFGGALASTSATDLGAMVIKEAIKRAGLDNETVDEVIMGNVLPAGLGQNPARQAMLKMGLPYHVGAITVNKVCGSGLKAVMLAAQAIACGDADVVVAGGLENMNLAPYYMTKARTGYRMGSTRAVDGMLHDGLWDHFNDFHMGMSAELCAEKYDVSRAVQDEFSLESYRRAVAAQAGGEFDAEIMPVSLPQRKGDPVLFGRDEVVRETGLADLEGLKPAFKVGGSVTAGNASKISDGAAAVVVVSEEYARAHGLTIMARIGAQASDGLDPKYVLVAPMLAVPKVLKKAGLGVDDIELYEINEAFASSSVAVIRELGIHPEKVNIRGGAIALGHPIGASGARVLATLLYAMIDRQAGLGLATLCLGGGEAVAMIVDRSAV